MRRRRKVQVERDLVDTEISSELVLQPVNDDVSVRRKAGGVVKAQRSHAFNAVRLNMEQQMAADRYLRDWALRAGVRVDDGLHFEPFIVVDNAPGLAPGQRVTQRMVDAGKRLRRAHQLVGLLDERLLTHLVQPMVLHGEIRVWRILVKEATGVDERHAQGILVQRACDNLIQAYRVLDREKKRGETPPT